MRMAVVSTKLQSSIVLKYKTGVDEGGNDVFESQRFAKVNTASPDQLVYDVAEAIGTLVSYPVTQIIRDDLNSIISE
jgi:hypothetical protein